MENIEELKKELKKYEFENNFSNSYGLKKINEYNYEYSYIQPVNNFLLKIISKKLNIPLKYKEDDNNEICQLLIWKNKKWQSYNEICQNLKLPTW